MLIKFDIFCLLWCWCNTTWSNIRNSCVFRCFGLPIGCYTFVTPTWEQPETFEHYYFVVLFHELKLRGKWLIEIMLHLVTPWFMRAELKIFKQINILNQQTNQRDNSTVWAATLSIYGLVTPRSGHVTPQSGCVTPPIWMCYTIVWACYTID